MEVKTDVSDDVKAATGTRQSVPILKQTSKHCRGLLYGLLLK